jgi:hypothetical protein
MKKLLIRRISFSLLAMLVTVLITFTHAVAQEVPFYWDYINVNIDVQTNGDMLVTEEEELEVQSTFTREILNIAKPNWQQGNFFWNIISFLFRMIIIILVLCITI